MKITAVFLALAITGVAAADWVYRGTWGFINGEPQGVAVSPAGNVYVDCSHDRWMACYTSEGSLLGSWYMEEPLHS